MEKEVTVKIDWTNQDEFPSELSENGFSVDVLVYCEKLNLHTVGWYQYRTNKWFFLCEEQHIEKFVWRNFIDEIDKCEN